MNNGQRLCSIVIRTILGEVSRSSVSASMNIKYTSKVVGVVCWDCQEGFPEELVHSEQEFSGRRRHRQQRAGLREG